MVFSTIRPRIVCSRWPDINESRRDFRARIAFHGGMTDGCYLLGISIHLHIKKYVKNVIHMLTKGSGGMDIISTLYRHYIDIMQMA